MGSAKLLSAVVQDVYGGTGGCREVYGGAGGAGRCMEVYGVQGSVWRCRGCRELQGGAGLVKASWLKLI